jgi:hypothetical protein
VNAIEKYVRAERVLLDKRRQHREFGRTKLNLTVMPPARGPVDGSAWEMRLEQRLWLSLIGKGNLITIDNGPPSPATPW